MKISAHGSSKLIKGLLTALLLVAVVLPLQGQDENTMSRDEVAMNMAAGELLVDKAPIPLTEILGPLAPVALSPFFGITCLSGAAILVDRGVLPDNALLGGNAVLGNELTFVLFLILAIVTSLPRLTKVSKPVAELADQLETWSGIVAYGVILFAAKQIEQEQAAAPVIMQAGLVSFTADTLLMAAVVVNIFVINTVRFFFEILILLSPIPALDALFEAANKTVVAVLMGLYLFSPALATGLNLILFAICLLIFLAVWKRVRCWRHLLFGLLFKIRPDSNQSRKFRGFIRKKGFPEKKLRYVELLETDSEWTLTPIRLFGSPPSRILPQPVSIQSGLLSHTLTAGDGCEILLSRRYDRLIPGDEANRETTFRAFQSADKNALKL